MRTLVIGVDISEEHPKQPPFCSSLLANGRKSKLITIKVCWWDLESAHSWSVDGSVPQSCSWTRGKWTPAGLTQSHTSRSQDFTAGSTDPPTQRWKLDETAEWNISGATANGTVQLFVVPATPEGWWWTGEGTREWLKRHKTCLMVTASRTPMCLA